MFTKPSRDTTLQIVELEKFHVGIKNVVDNAELRGVQFDVLHETKHAMLLSLSAYVLCETVQTEEATWPADWWQAVKERFFPAWAKRRWPVERKGVRLEAKLLYPKLKAQLPDEETRLRFVRIPILRYED